MKQFVVIVAFFVSIAQAYGQAPRDNVVPRGALTNSAHKFTTEKTGHVAFLGGSITEMNGYRPIVSDMLAQRFPNTKFTFTNAGISSTCSTTGAFRLMNDVLAKGPVDLLFVEFAVNDDQDAQHARRECIRGMEGIVRRTRAHNPYADIVITYFVNPGMLKTIEEGKVPLTIAAHEEVAKHYDISTVHLASEVADRIKAKTLTWERYGGVHPARPGNELCAELIERLLTTAWKTAPYAPRKPHLSPKTPLDVHSYGGGRYLGPGWVKLGEGWRNEVPAWKNLAGQARERFRNIKMLCAETPGSALSVIFEGDAIGAYVTAGPDAGVVEASLDDGPWTKFDLYHRFSKNLHYPRTVMFAAGLVPGEHTLKLRLAKEMNADSKGHAVRIVELVVNDNRRVPPALVP